MLLVGIGGSGRQSLSRLGAYIIGFQVFQIEISRHYRLQEFREGTATSFLFFCDFDFLKDVRKLYWKAGVDNKPTVFLFTDTQVVEESFLEDINNILSSGEVPNLYNPEEFEEVRMQYFFYYVCLSCVCVCARVCVYNLHDFLVFSGEKWFTRCR